MVAAVTALVWYLFPRRIIYMDERVHKTRHDWVLEAVDRQPHKGMRVELPGDRAIYFLRDFRG